jgi:hypothetical protein
MVSIFNRIVEAATGNVSAGAMSRWLELTNHIRESFYHSYIITPEQERIHVTGGLPSGLYLTSIVGDGFNKTACNAVITLLREVGVRVGDDDVDLKIQGDDSSFLDWSVATLQMIDWMLSRMGFIGGTGKFGITSESTEFLRVAYNSEGCFGYPARAVAGIVERKPWSDTPMKETDIIEAILDAVAICERRGMMMNDSADRLLRIWCRKNKISYVAARTPHMNGGYGIGEPILDTRVTGLPVMGTISGVSVERKTTYREDKWRTIAKSLGVAVSEERLVDISNAESIATVVGDEVRGLTKKVRDAWKEAVKRSKVKVNKLNRFGLRCDVVIEPILNDVASGTEVELKQGFESEKEMGGVLTQLRTLLPTKVEVDEWLIQNKPGYFRKLQSMMDHCTYNEAEAWLTGKMPFYCGKWNPLCAEGFKRNWHR